TGGGSADGIRVRDLGYLVVREVQDDNSCLFNAIAFTVDQSMKTNIQGLRKIIAQAIEADPETYTDAMLGRPRKEYCDWIQRENSWGGAIELAIFSEHYKIEIDSIEVLSTRVDRFDYDAVALTPGYELPADCDQTQFDSSEEYIIKTGIQLAERLRKAHKFTDLATFTLRCSTCQTGLRGQKDAHQHAMETMHVAFEEYV
ncbi:ubiquitin-specific protease otu1, partial [Lunasporangiospora selenospora]